LAGALAARLAADGAQPFVTYYNDATGERTELSVATLNNWVAKTANLLVDGLGLQPGDTVRLAVPLHWQEVAIRFACLSAGADIVDHGPSAVLFWAETGTATGAEPPRDADDVVGVSLQPLRRGLSRTYPGVLDYDAELPGYADSFAAPAPEPEQLRLLSAAGTAWPLLPGERVLVTEADPDGLIELSAVATERASLVIWPDPEEARLPTRCTAERVTALARGGMLTRL
jgi:uncharacterized protein (TIGR03089 family)